MELHCVVISILLSLFNASGIFGVVDSPRVKRQNHYEIISPCDTLRTEQFLKLVDTLYIRIDSFQNLSGIEQRKIIRVYNSIYLLQSSLKNRNNIVDFQKRFDLVIKKLIIEDKQLIIEKNSAIFFPHLNVTLLNDVLVRTSNYKCSDIYCIYD